MNLKHPNYKVLTINEVLADASTLLTRLDAAMEFLTSDKGLELLQKNFPLAIKVLQPIDVYEEMLSDTFGDRYEQYKKDLYANSEK